MASPCSSSSSGRRLLLLAGGDVVAALLLLCTAVGCARDGSDLTAGFARMELQEGGFTVQSPYDVPVDRRYRYDAGTGVQTFVVYATDKPFNNFTVTNPRTEARLPTYYYNHNSSSPTTTTTWQFEGHVYVPCGTSGASVVQIHNENGGTPATAMMLHVYNGTMRWYSGAEVERDVYDRWVRVNVVHDVEASTVAVYVDGEPKLAVAVARSKSHYYKFGVYMQHHDMSLRMEVRWRNVSIYTKPY